MAAEANDGEKGVHVAVVLFVRDINKTIPFVDVSLVGDSQAIRDNIAMIIGMCLFVGLNYLGQNFFVFNNKK